MAEFADIIESIKPGPLEAEIQELLLSARDNPISPGPSMTREEGIVFFRALADQLEEDESLRFSFTINWERD